MPVASDGHCCCGGAEAKEGEGGSCTQIQINVSLHCLEKKHNRIGRRIGPSSPLPLTTPIKRLSPFPSPLPMLLGTSDLQLSISTSNSSHCNPITFFIARDCTVDTVKLIWYHFLQWACNGFSSYCLQHLLL